MSRVRRDRSKSGLAYGNSARYRGGGRAASVKVGHKTASVEILGPGSHRRCSRPSSSPVTDIECRRNTESSRDCAFAPSAPSVR